MQKKTITNTAKFIISAWNIGLFIAIWVGYYNSRTYHSHDDIGCVISCFVYAGIYFWFCNTYHAFKIASSSVPECIFNQVVSYGVADSILYLVCLISSHGYINIVPGLVTALLQGFGSAGIILFTKRYFILHVEPKETLIIYGTYASEREARLFGTRLLKKYNHLYSIKKYVSVNEKEAELFSEIDQFHTIILYEITGEQRETLLKVCSEKHKQFYFTPDIGDLICQGSTYKQLLDTPLMKYDYSYEAIKEYGLKRILDIVFSAFFLIVFSPLITVVAISIKIEDQGPVFYKQKRCTKNGKVFEMIKFRSMITDAEKNGVLPCTDNDPRITKVGKFIRAHRIDEIPQLFNILVGDMSFVGPRPERVEHVRQYTKDMPEFSYRLRVKGGLTGYAQIYGKYNTSAYDKLRLDLMYIENQSLIEDIKIVMLTFRTLFQRESTAGFEEEVSRAMQSVAQKNIQ